MYRHQLESLDQLTESGRAEQTMLQDRQADPDLALADAERQLMVRRAIRKLPDKQRAALLLRIEGEFSYKEIAEQIGRSVNHVKTLIHRGRLALRHSLGPYLGESS